MKTIKNITNQAQAVSNIPAFMAWEIRQVEDQIADILLLSPYFEEVRGSTDTKDKPKWGKGAKSDLGD